MNVLSVNVDLPRSVVWHGREVRTAIFKSPVAGRIPLRTLNLHGDEQADLTVHGGPDKAVYCYAFEHYDYWQRELPQWNWTPGAFGENFTTAGLPEQSVHVGDRFRVGSAELVVTQPRLPCFKLGLRFQSDDMVRRFLMSGRLGFYFAVLKEGQVGAGDSMELLSSDPCAVPTTEIARLYLVKHYGAAEVESANRAMRAEALPHSWKQYLSERLRSGSLRSNA